MRRFHRSLVKVYAVQSAMILLACVLTGCRPQPGPAEFGPTYPICMSSEAAHGVELRLRATLAAGGPFSLAISEGEATAYLAARAEGTPLQSPRMYFTTQGAYVQADVAVAGSHQMRVAGLPLCRNQRLQLDIAGAWLDGRPIPGIARASLQRAANDALTDAWLPFQCDQVTVGEGTITIIGTMR